MRIFVCLILAMSLVAAYTAQSYDSVDLILDSTTAPSYDSVDLILEIDSCYCPGSGNDWEINMSDYCIINSDCDLDTGKLSFVSTGNFTCNATITTSDMGDPGNNSIVFINNNCLINVK